MSDVSYCCQYVEILFSIYKMLRWVTITFYGFSS